MNKKAYIMLVEDMEYGEELFIRVYAESEEQARNIAFFEGYKVKKILKVVEGKTPLEILLEWLEGDKKKR